MIDTHAHLDACDRPADELVRRAVEAGVEAIVAVGSGVASCHEALAIAGRPSGVVAALGIHPHQAGETRDEDLDELRGMLVRPGAAAVGETGLDYFRDYAPHDAQRALFRDQIALGTELGKPIVVKIALNAPG